MRFATLAFAACLAVVTPLFGFSLPAQDLFRRQEAPREIASAEFAVSPAPDAVRVDVALVESGPEQLSLELVAGEGRLAYRTAFERTAWGGVVWRGRFADGDPGYAGITLSVHGGVLVGSLRTPEGRAYLIEPRAPGDWELRTEEATAFACDVGRDRPAELAEGLELPNEPHGAASDPVAAAKEESREVGILVVYTPAAARDFSVTGTDGRERLVARAFHNVDRLNSAWINSGIDGRAILVGVEEFDPDPGIFGFSVGSAISLAKKDPRVQALRDERGADVVSVVISAEEAKNGCGQADAVMSRSLLGPQMAPRAYFSIGAHCFSGPTFIHETGHLFGAHHNVETAPPQSEPAFPFAFAHGVDGKFRTVMAYPSACSDCFPYEVFSNPLVSIEGEPTGIDGQRDNAQTLNLTMPIVAAFRETEPVSAPFPFRKPAKPTKLVAELDASSVRLAWRDNARNETSYLIEVKGPGSATFTAIALAEPNAKSAYLRHAAAGGSGVYLFRVVALSGSFRSAPSNVAQLTVP